MIEDQRVLVAKHTLIIFINYICIQNLSYVCMANYGFLNLMFNMNGGQVLSTCNWGACDTSHTHQLLRSCNN